jgi:hypothetical protein
MTAAMPTLEELARAFGFVESTHDYGQIGPPTRSGDRAYGYYQVMGENVPSWTERWVGRRMTPQEFLADPAAQDAVFYGQLGQYWNELPDADPELRVRNAASRWFSGRPWSAETAGLNDTYITNQEYGDRVLRSLGMTNGAPTMTMDPNAPPTGFMGGVQNTMQTIGQGIGTLFQPWRDAPREGGETDPFTGLSRNQRMLLGFAALRDAAASLQGEQSDYFTSALDTYEQGRERSRLRQQGMLQNLAALQQARAYAAFSGDQQALAAFDAALAQVYDELGATGVTPAAQPTAAQPTVTPTTGGGQPAQQPLTTQQRIDEIDAELNRLAGGSVLGIDTSAQMQLLLAERERLAAAQEEEAVATEETQAEATRAQDIILPRIDAALDYLVEGTDPQTGEPVINPALTTSIGMAAFQRLNPTAYRDLENILNTIRSGQLLETLQTVTTGALSEGEIAVFGGTQGTLDINDPRGTIRTLLQIQQAMEELLAREQGANENNPFTELD